MGTVWTHALVEYGLDRFHRRHLRTPTQREIRAGLEDVPSLATVWRMYGSVGRMLEAHGYRPRTVGGTPGLPCVRGRRRDASGRFVA